nr:MAG TPA: hypothetical protein [Caudoviricetes sp.]
MFILTYPFLGRTMLLFTSTKSVRLILLYTGV